MTENGRLDPLLGRTVADGRYEVRALLGVGGMGTVYQAIQHPLERQVALKLIHRALALNEDIVARFEREMRMTASIEHPHTVRVYDFGRIDGQPFLAMEYLAGRSLRAVLDAAGALPSERLASIGLQVAKALRAAHQAGIVHRDLKPDNVVLVDGYGERDFVKVLDFGIARPLEPEPGFQTVTGAIVGTPAYMSPEQATGAPVDTRSDLYALGVMLFEMATGAPPFAGRSTTALLLAHASERPPSLDGFSSIPGAVRGLIERLLQKDPQARPASADEVIEALAPFAASETGSAAMPVVPGATRPPLPAAMRSGATGGQTPGHAPRVGGTLVLPDDAADRRSEGDPRARASGARGRSQHDRPSAAVPGAGSGRAEPGTASAARGAGGKILAVVLGLAVLGGAATFVYLRGDRTTLSRDGHPGGATRASDAGLLVADGGAGPRGDEPLDPAITARLSPLLQAAGEPPWPDACRSRDAAVLRQLAEIASALLDGGRGAPALATAPALEKLRALPGSFAERWTIEARVTLSSDAATAAAAAAKAAALCPSSPVAHNLLGNALQRTQRLEPAERAYRAAFQLAPAFLAPRFNLGLIRLRRDDAAGALAAFEAVGHADAGYPNLPLVRAEAHRRLGDAAAARADLRDQVARHPTVVDGWIQLGRALTAAHDRRGARDAFCHAKALGDASAAPLCRP